MNKLLNDILQLTKEDKIITEKQLFRLLIVNGVKFTKDNYVIINSFLEENDIILTRKDIENVDNSKKNVLAK